MKTVIIFDSCEATLKFRVVDGDYSHLNNCYMNSMDTAPEVVDEISNLVFYPEGHEKAWHYLEDFQDDFPHQVFNEPAGTVKVIVLGMIP